MKTKKFCFIVDYLGFCRRFKIFLLYRFVCQWLVQEFVGGGVRRSKRLFFCLSIFQGGPCSENSRENDISEYKSSKNIGEIA